MALFGALDKTNHFDEFSSPLVTAEGVMTPNARKALALANLMTLEDFVTLGSTSTSTEVTTFNGNEYLTTITCTAFPIMATIGDNASLADGAVLVSLPAGTHVIESGQLNGTVDAAASVTTDTPEIGMGTTEASGANATLGAVAATAEDILGPFVAADVSAGAVAGFNAASGPKQVTSGSAIPLYLNAADGWADRDPGTVPLTFTGTITLRWRTV